MTAKPATILSSQVRLMKSKPTGRKYHISIGLPYACFLSDQMKWPFKKPLKKWPVVYVLDGNWHFGLVTGMVRHMGMFGDTTDAIVVGIGYPEGQNPHEALYDSIAGRFQDYTPIRDDGVEKWVEELVKRPARTGGAGDFLHFIKHELVPDIEQDFPADPHKRILAGHSTGGLFTAFALLEEPNLFNTYIIGSPALGGGMDSYSNVKSCLPSVTRNLRPKSISG